MRGYVVTQTVPVMPRDLPYKISKPSLPQKQIVLLKPPYDNRKLYVTGSIIDTTLNVP